MDEESCATLLLLNTTSIRIVRFIVFGESSAATYYKSIHQFTRNQKGDSAVPKKNIEEIVEVWASLLLIIIGIIILNIPQ